MDGANKEDVEIGSPIVRAQLWNLSEDSACFLTENTEQCVYLTRLIEKRGRLPRLKAELKTKPHRHERIEFLKQHVLRLVVLKSKILYSLSIEKVRTVKNNLSQETHPKKMGASTRDSPMTIIFPTYSVANQK